jgi:hypothetical protein
MVGSPGPKLLLHATSENAQQLLAGATLHSGNTLWKS